MNIYNVIILDESGSMSSIYRETVQSMNEVINGIRKNQEDTRRDRVPIGVIRDFTTRDYRPGGCTPLYDAMGKTLNELESLILEDDRVFATIITDGYENSSREYSGRTIKELVNRLREKGWILAYIGANQDAVEVARDLHIDNALDYCASPLGVKRMCIKFKKAGATTAALFDREVDKRVLSRFRDLFSEDNKEGES